MNFKTAQGLNGKIIEIRFKHDVWNHSKMSYVNDPNFVEQVYVSNVEKDYIGYMTFGSDEGHSIGYRYIKAWRELKGGKWKK